MKKLFMLLFASFFLCLYGAIVKEDFTLEVSPSPRVKEKVKVQTVVHYLYQLNVALSKIVTIIGSVLVHALTSIKHLLEGDKDYILLKSPEHRSEHRKKLKKLLDACAVFEKELHAYCAA